MGRNTFAGLVLAISMLYASRLANANLIMQSSTAWNGTAPTSAITPWLEADFVDGPNHTVLLTLKALHLSSHGSGKNTVQEDVQDWLFNVNPNITPSDLSFSETSHTGTFTQPTVSATSQNAQKTQASVLFDVDFGLSKGGSTFTQGDSVTFTILDTNPSYKSMFSSADFNYTTSRGAYGPFYDSAHIQNTGPNGSGSGDIAATTATTVTTPEPVGGMVAAMSGLLLLARRRQACPR